MEACYEKGVSYNGYDLTPSPTKTQTAKLCGELCYADPRCFWWSWSSTEKTCQVKGGLNPDKDEGRRKAAGYISGMSISAYKMLTTDHILIIFLGRVISLYRDGL